MIHFKKFTDSLRTSVCIALLFAVVGCATTVTETAQAPEAISVSLGAFDEIVLVKSHIAAKYAEHPANIKAVNKIDELLDLKLLTVFSNRRIASVGEAEEWVRKSKNAVLIKPRIKQIKFIGGAGRFWVGALAGSSVVVMDVDFVDARSGDIIGKTGTYQKAAAMGGAHTFGVTDNLMLSRAVEEIFSYIIANR